MQLVNNIYLPYDIKRAPQPPLQDHPGEARQPAGGPSTRRTGSSPSTSTTSTTEASAARRRSASARRHRCSSTSPWPTSISRRSRCSPGCPRRRPSTTRSRTQRPPASGAPRCSRRWCRRATSPRRQANAANASRSAGASEQHVPDGPATVRVRLRQGAADQSASARASSTTAASRSTRRSTSTTRQLALDGAARPRGRAGRPGRRTRLDRPVQRPHPGDAELDPLQRQRSVQLRRRRRAPDRLRLQGVRADDADQGLRRRPER